MEPIPAALGQENLNSSHPTRHGKRLSNGGEGLIAFTIFFPLRILLTVLGCSNGVFSDALGGGCRISVQRYFSAISILSAHLESTLTAAAHVQ